MTGHLLYTEEDVTLGAIAISRARLDSYTWEKVVMVVLDDLAARGRLVPPEPDWTKVTDLVVEWPPYGRSPSVPDTEESGDA